MRGQVKTRDMVLRTEARGGQVARTAICVVLINASFLLLTIPAVAKDKRSRSEADHQKSKAVLWSNPGDIASRDLFYGSGGRADEPHTTYTFIKEDLNGSNPKFDVRDENGTKWRVKLGLEAQPEVAATRLLWAVGYFTEEDYFLPVLQVQNMQALKRGRKLIGPDGTMHNVRLKRDLKGEKKAGDWDWRDNPFSGTREWNGLRVMMALLNNWDLKAENNAAFEEKGDEQDAPLRYMVSDLGATFGAAGITFPLSHSKGDLREYSRSKFIKRATPESVDFNVPARPSLWRLVNLKAFRMRMHMRWIGQNVPRADARWIGQLLAQLSNEQIRQAFRSAGYSPQEVEGFANVVEQRINELNQL